MAIAWLAVIVIGGISGLAALCLCWFLIGFGGEDSEENTASQINGPFGLVAS